MPIDWIKGFIIPIVELVFIGGISLYVGYIVWKAVSNGWEKSMKFIWKYKIPPKKAYPENTVAWVLNCIDQGIGWYDAKKVMLIHGNTEDQINETLWIYDQIINEMSLKGGVDKNGRRFETSHRKIESTTETKFPPI
jgi:hypothetical protein